MGSNSDITHNTVAGETSREGQFSDIRFKHLIRGSDVGNIAVLHFAQEGEDKFWTAEGLDYLAQQYAHDHEALHQLEIARRHLAGSFDAPVYEMQSDLFGT